MDEAVTATWNWLGSKKGSRRDTSELGDVDFRGVRRRRVEYEDRHHPLSKLRHQFHHYYLGSVLKSSSVPIEFILMEPIEFKSELAR